MGMLQEGEQQAVDIDFLESARRAKREGQKEKRENEDARKACRARTRNELRWTSVRILAAVNSREYLLSEGNQKKTKQNCMS